MKKSLKIVFCLVSLFEIQQVYAMSWITDYFNKKESSPQSDATSKDNSPLEKTLIEYDLPVYKKLSYPEDQEEFINKKLKTIYSLQKTNPNLFTSESIDQIIHKMETIYKSATERNSIVFSPKLNRFFILHPSSDKRHSQKKAVIGQLEDMNIYEESLKSLQEIHERTEKEIAKIEKEIARLKEEEKKESAKIEKDFENTIKSKTDDFKTSAYEREEEAEEAAREAAKKEARRREVNHQYRHGING